MNIFFLDINPKICAQYHTDKHVVKMILESAQLLSTAHRVLDGTDNKLQDADKDLILYKATHQNHPSALWARESKENYYWLYSLYLQLCQEYTHRYCKIHKSQGLFELLRQPPKNIQDKPFNYPTPVMDEQFILGDTVQSYRNYYNLAKKSLFKWTKRDVPKWAVIS